MGVKYREKSSSETNIPTWKRYRAKPFGGENGQFSRTSVIRSEIKPMLQHFVNALGLRLSMFQSLRNGAGSQIKAPLKIIDTASEVISSYWPCARRPNHTLTDFKFSSFESSSIPFSIPFLIEALIDPKIDPKSKRKKLHWKNDPRLAREHDWENNPPIPRAIIKFQDRNLIKQSLLEAQKRRSREPAASHPKSNKKNIAKTIPAEHRS